MSGASFFCMVAIGGIVQSDLRRVYDLNCRVMMGKEDDSFDYDRM